MVRGRHWASKFEIEIGMYIVGHFEVKCKSLVQVKAAESPVRGLVAFLKRACPIQRVGVSY